MNLMRKGIACLVALMCTAALIAQKTVINDPNAEVRNVKGFHGIEVNSAINLYLSQADDEAVAVSAKDTKYRDRIKTEIKNGILRIWLEHDVWSLHTGNMQLKAYVSFKTIDKLTATGASDILVDGVINGNNLDLTLSGASDFKGAVKVNDLNMDQSGASDCTIKGTVTSLKIEASGASNVKGYELVTDNCSVRASGASDIRISVNKELNAHLSGASSVYYKGDAVIKDLHSSGASNVSRKS